MTKLKEKDLISLKEAGEVSGYSADYIGQLIRSGKIPGKQVYTNISWMTTADAVLAYKNASKNKDKTPTYTEKILNAKRKLEMELSIIKLILQNFKSAIPLIIILLVIFSALLFSIFYFTNNTVNPGNKNIQEQNQETIKF
ncbi:hypothetical protein C0583_05525 [Candidatus Parcubacteria bacterium]|nr:MAG: hypothetical protein C0583_05525 [Candidatus Parcubacteria bacterium]